MPWTETTSILIISLSLAFEFGLVGSHSQSLYEKVRNLGSPPMDLPRGTGIGRFVALLTYSHLTFAQLCY